MTEIKYGGSKIKKTKEPYYQESYNDQPKATYETGYKNQENEMTM